ncbi:MAG: hypothetical protein DESF_01303 [Desulfovibrio sp.]
MRLLFLCLKESPTLAQGRLMIEIEDRMLQLFPGSVMYGPGYDNFKTCDVMEILEEYGGENSFDGIFCRVPERELAGDALGFHYALKYQLSSNLWNFPVNLGKSKLPKLLWIADCWHLTPQDWCRVLLTTGINVVMSGIAPPFFDRRAFDFYFPRELQEQVTFLPYGIFISQNIFKPGEVKEHDILLAGAQVPDFYPQRAYMREAFKRSDLSVFEPPHPGYSQLENVSPVSTYPDYLPKCKISAFCSSKFHFPTLKLMEAMASKTIALCDSIYGIEHLGMEPDKHFILADSSNCVEKARRWLSDPDLYNEMTEAAYELFSTRHTLEIRLKELAELIPAVLNGQPAGGWAALSPNHRLVCALRRSKTAESAEHEPITTTRDYWESPVTVQKDTWQYWYKLFPLHQIDEDIALSVRTPPHVELRMAAVGHMEVFKAQWLLDRIEQKNMRTFLEIGTGAGYHSILWAEYLKKQGKRGLVLAEDAIDNSQLIACMSPQYLDMPLNRSLLWKGMPITEDIQFIPRRANRFAPLAGKKLDFIFLNGTANLWADYEELRHCIGVRTLVAVNMYGPAFVDRVEQTRKIAKELGRNILHLDFGQYDSGLGMLVPEVFSA